MDDVERVARQLESMFCALKWDDLPAVVRAEWMSHAKEVLAALRQPTPEPTRRTVKVRVAVAVKPDGEWNAKGSSRIPDSVARSMARFFGAEEANQQVVSFITAELPIPEDVTVQATVEGGE